MIGLWIQFLTTNVADKIERFKLILSSRFNSGKWSCFQIVEIYFFNPTGWMLTTSLSILWPLSPRWRRSKTTTRWSSSSTSRPTSTRLSRPLRSCTTSTSPRSTPSSGNGPKSDGPCCSCAPTVHSNFWRFQLVEFKKLSDWKYSSCIECHENVSLSILVLIWLKFRRNHLRSTMFPGG